MSISRSQDTWAGTPTKPTGLLSTGCGPSQATSEWEATLPMYTSSLCWARLPAPHRLFPSSSLTDGTTVPIAPALPFTHLTASGELWEGGRKLVGARVPPLLDREAGMGGRRWSGGGVLGLGPMTKDGQTGGGHHSGATGLQEGGGGSPGPVQVSRRPPEPWSPGLSHRSQCVSSWSGCLWGPLTAAPADPLPGSGLQEAACAPTDLAWVQDCPDPLTPRCVPP